MHEERKSLVDCLEDKIKQKRSPFFSEQGSEIELLKANLVLARIYSAYYSSTGKEAYYDLADIKVKNASRELRNYYKSSLNEIYGGNFWLSNDRSFLTEEHLNAEENLKHNVERYRMKIFGVMRDYNVGSSELKENIKGYPKF